MPQTFPVHDWLPPYLQVAVAILLFGLGIPALVMQVIVPQELRSVMHRRRRVFALAAWLVVPAAVVTLAFIWLHPLADDSFGWWVGANLATSAVIGFTAIFWWAQAWYRRDRVVRYLERKCARTIRQRGTPDEQALDDLRFLGEQGEGGIEKRLVLDALGRLAQQLQEHEGYSGRSLDEVMNAVESTLRGGGKGASPAQSATQEIGDSEDFCAAAAICEKILERLQPPSRGYDQRLPLSLSPDVAATLRVIERVGSLAIELNYEAAARSLLDVLPKVTRGTTGAFGTVSRVLFQLGAVALERRRYRLAVEALNRMETLAAKGKPLAGEGASNYLGLVAHFWASGHTARVRARWGLGYIPVELPLQDRLRQAERHHADQARFDTVDHLIHIERDLLRRPEGKGAGPPAG